MNLWIDVHVVSSGYSVIALRLSWLGHIPRAETWWPRYSISCWKKLHLEGFSFNLFRYNCSSTSLSLSKCLLSMEIDDSIIQAHKTYGVVKLSETVLYQPLKGHWGITEPKQHVFALIEPQHTHCEGCVLLRPFCHRGLPESWQQIYCSVVFGTSKTFMASWILGKGKASFLVQEFKCLKSIQNLMLLQVELLGLMVPTSNMWSRWSLTSCNNPSSMFLGLSLNCQGLVSSMWCLVASVHPIFKCKDVMELGKKI